MQVSKLILRYPVNHIGCTVQCWTVSSYFCSKYKKNGVRMFKHLILTVFSAWTAKPEWIQKPVDSQLEEGRAGYLHCLTRATPEPVVTWYRNMQPIGTEVSGAVMSCSYHIWNAICNCLEASETFWCVWKWRCGTRERWSSAAQQILTLMSFYGRSSGEDFIFLEMLTHWTKTYWLWSHRV